MTKHANIAAALAAAQSQMGKAIKDSQNPHFRSKYADLASVCDACMPALNANGIAVIQPLVESEFGRSVVTRFIHESGETLDCPIPLILGKNDMQGLGSAITYARRYGLMSLAGIAPEDDDGNAAVAGMRNDSPPQTPRFDPRAAADRLITSANKKRGNEVALGELWKEEKAALANLSDDLFEEVKAAFAAAKSSPAPANITDDEIPY